MDAATTKGRLLVASPALLDPNFDRTVILMLEHNAEGALGLVLNRPSGIDVADGFEAWADWSRPPACLFVGGPVQPEAAFCVALVGADDVRATLRPTASRRSWRASQSPISIARRCGSRPRSRRPASSAATQAGRGGQLERELREEAWFVVDAEDDDVFVAEPETLWRDVLRRQRGALQWIANFPDDPRDN